MKKSVLLILPFIVTLSINASSPNSDSFFNDPFGDDIFKEMMQMQKQMDKMFEQMHQKIQQKVSGIITPTSTFRMTQKSQFVDKNDRYELVTNIPQSDENNININTNPNTANTSANTS